MLKPTKPFCMEEALNNQGDKITQPVDVSQPIFSHPSASAVEHSRVAMVARWRLWKSSTVSVPTHQGDLVTAKHPTCQQ